MLEIFLTAIALVLFIEGILPFAVPKLWRQVMLRMAAREDSSIRKAGLITLVAGVALMCLVHAGLL